MNNLHETFGAAHLDFEIGEHEARMIESIVSFKLGYTVEYHGLAVRQFSGRKYTVEVQASGQIIEFLQPWIRIWDSTLHNLI